MSELKNATLDPVPLLEQEKKIETQESEYLQSFSNQGMFLKLENDVSLLQDQAEMKVSKEWNERVSDFFFFFWM